MPTWPSPRSERLGTPDSPAIRFARGTYFGASWFTHLLRPVRLLAPLYGSDWNAQPTGASTSRLSTDRSPSPLLDMTTTATGLLCWLDFHPLEWQLASLHQNRTCGFPAYGSHLGCVTAKVAVYAPARLSREPGSGSSTCCAGAYSPWPPPFAPPTPLRRPRRRLRSGFALFAGFIATMTRSDFSGPCIIGFGSSPSRCGPPYTRRRRPDTRSPRFRCDPFARDVALDPGRASAPRITVPHMLPSSE